jgi:hypothetical protein
MLPVIEDDLDCPPATARLRLGALAATLAACGRRLADRSPMAARFWAAAADALAATMGGRASTLSEGEALLADAAIDPLAPPWLVVEGLIALISDQVPEDAHPDEVVALDRSLGGLIALAARLQRIGAVAP